MSEYRITRLKLGATRPKPPAPLKRSDGVEKRGQWKLVSITAMGDGRIAVAWKWAPYVY